MAGASAVITQIDDVIVPENFTPYVQQLTEEKARLVQSGAVARNAQLDADLAGGGLTFNAPSWRDLDNDDDNVSTDAIPDAVAWTQLSGTAVGANYPTLNDSTPNDTSADQEIAVRLSRNGSWSTADLAAALAGDDPAESIAQRVSYYWARRLQAAFIATWSGVCKDNAVSDSADYANDIAGTAFVDGVTNFSAEAYLDAKVTMGDSMDNLTMVMVHSIVFNRMQKNNLIDFIPDSTGQVQIPTFLGAEVIIDDGMPNGTSAVRDTGSAGVVGIYETWLFGAGATQLGMGTPKVPTEVQRYAAAGNGGGAETLYNRVEWCIHPVGHAFTAAAPANGGPSNAATTNNLNIATSWDRVFPERKQINFARLVTRES